MALVQSSTGTFYFNIEPLFERELYQALLYTTHHFHQYGRQLLKLSLAHLSTPWMPLIQDVYCWILHDRRSKPPGALFGKDELTLFGVTANR